MSRSVCELEEALSNIDSAIHSYFSLECSVEDTMDFLDQEMTFTKDGQITITLNDGEYEGKNIFRTDDNGIWTHTYEGRTKIVVKEDIQDLENMLYAVPDEWNYKELQDELDQLEGEEFEEDSYDYGSPDELEFS